MPKACIARQLAESGRACLDAPSLAVEVFEEEGWGTYTTYLFEDDSKAICFESFPWHVRDDDYLVPNHQFLKESVWDFYTPSGHKIKNVWS